MAAISRQVRERSSIIVLTVLTLILVDSTSGHPLHWLLRSLAISLPSKNALCNANACIRFRQLSL